MSRLSVYTEGPTGGDRIWLDALAEVQGLRYSKAFPGGDREASWQSRIPSDAQHRAWAPGRRVGIVCGASTIWSGTLDTPERGDVWSFTAVGRAADASRYRAVAATSGNALALNETVDAAISRGLNWTRSASLPSLTDGIQPSGAISIDEALAAVTNQLGSYWTVDRAGVITVTALPSTVTQLLIASTPAGARTLDGFVSDVYVSYIDATSRAVTVRTRSNTAARTKFGRSESLLDVTELGPMTSTQADAAGDAYLATHAPRVNFTSAFDVTPGQLLTVGGAAVDLALAEPGRLTKVLLTDPDSVGEVSSGTVSLVMGGTDYDVDADVLTLTPMDSSGTSLMDALATSTSPAASSPGITYPALVGETHATANGTQNATGSLVDAAATVSVNNATPGAGNLAVTVSVVAGRTYRVASTVVLSSSVVNDVANYVLTDGTNTYGDPNNRISLPTTSGWSASNEGFYYATSTGTVTFKVQIQRIAGTGNINVGAGSVISVTDVT